MSLLYCDVVAKDRVMYSGELYSITVPGAEGDLGVLENHDPYLVALRDGVIWGRQGSADGPIICAANMGGYLQVLKNRVIVLCDKTREIKDINLERLEFVIPEMEERLESLSEEQFISGSLLKRKLRWCRVMRDARKKALEGKLPFPYTE